MRFSLATLLLTCTLSAWGIELQCQTQYKELEVVLKSSPETQRYYMLLFNEGAVSPYLLASEGLELSPDSFKYKDSNVEILVHYESKEGQILFPQGESIELKNCHNTEI